MSKRLRISSNVRSTDDVTHWLVCCALCRRTCDIGEIWKRKDWRLCQNGSDIYWLNGANTTLPSFNACIYWIRNCMDRKDTWPWDLRKSAVALISAVSLQWYYYNAIVTGYRLDKSGVVYIYSNVIFATLLERNLATGVRTLYVCLSVTRWYWLKTNERRNMRFSPPGSPGTLIDFFNFYSLRPSGTPVAKASNETG